MANLNIKQNQSIKLRQKPGQVLRMQQADFLEMPQGEFYKFIIELERTPLFRKLRENHRLIRYQRFHGSDIHSGFYQLNEEVAPDSRQPDIPLLLAEKKELVSQIRKLGEEKFKRYFLFPEFAMTPEETAKECGLEASDVARINNLMDTLSVMSEFYHSPAVAHGSIRHSKVARIEKHGGDFSICYLSPCMARGRYSIDYKRFEAIRSTGAFAAPEIRQIRRLFKELNLINNRKDTLSLILQNIAEKQARYLKSGDEEDLLPFSQKELAGETGLAPSSICRAITGHSVETPCGQELPLKLFFPRTRMFKMRLLKSLLETGGKFPSDEAIRESLEKKFKMTLSRRSVADLRKRLGIAAMQKTRKIRSPVRRAPAEIAGEFSGLSWKA